MAISPMSRVTLLAPKTQIESILKTVQKLQNIEIIDLQDTDAMKKLSHEAKELVENYNGIDDNPLTDREYLQTLTNRQKRIERAIRQIKHFVPQPSMLQKLMSDKPKIRFDEIEAQGQSYNEDEIIDKVDRLTDSLTILDEKIYKLTKKRDELRKWRHLDVTPNELKTYKYIKGIIGTVPSTNEDQFIHFIRENDELEIQTVFIDEYDYGLILFVKDMSNKALINELKDYQFVPFKYSSDLLPAQKIENYEEKIKQAKVDKAKALEQLKNSQDILSELKIQYEYVANLSVREQAKLLLGQSTNLITVEGWTDSRYVNELKELIQSKYSDVMFKVTEVQNPEKEDVPTKLSNHPLISPFETLVTMYGIPNYTEIDPTPFVAPFYFVFFGMMVADFGYGLLLVLLSGIIFALYRGENKTREMIKLAHMLSWSVTLWGVVYGSFFGYSIPSIQLIDFENQVIEVMLLAICIGVIHLILAFTLNVYIKSKNRKYALAYAEGGSWILIFMGLIMIVIGKVTPALSVLSSVGGLISGISFLAMFIAYLFETGSIAGLGSGLLGLINGVSYFGDVINYSRLMALGLSGISIGAAFNLIIQQLPGVWQYTAGALIFVALHGFNLFLSLLTAAVHALRLIFVEFFGKFYTGQGREFRPLRFKEEYVSIKKENKIGD